MNPSQLLFLPLLIVSLLPLQSFAETPTAVPKPILVGLLAPSADGNLLVNSSFENGTEGWELVAFDKKGTMSIDTAELHGGKPTLRIDNVEGDHSFVREVITGKPNTRYRLTGYIKTKNVKPVKPGEKCGAVLMVGMTLDCSRPIDKTVSWTKVTLDFTTKDSTEIRVGPSLGFYASKMTGTAWFSELKLIELGGNARR